MLLKRRPRCWRLLLLACLVTAALTGCLLLYRLCRPLWSSLSVCPAASPDAAAVGGEAPQSRLPTAIIIGARKAGTRALLEMIRLHPKVRCAPKEVHFFDCDSNYERGLEWYRNRMPFSSEDQITIEKSPSYFISSVSPERVFMMDPGVRLIVLLREPVSRLISDFTQLALKRQRQGLPAVSFRERVFSGRSVRAESQLVKTSLYHRYVRRWLQYFPRGQLLLLDSEQLVTDPLEAVLRVERHLGLSSHITSENFFFNSTKGFYCIRWQSGESKCLGSTKGLPHVQVDDELKTKLRRFFAPHNDKLYRLVGHNYKWPRS